MRRPRPHGTAAVGLVLGLGASVAACALLTSTSGLTGGGAADAAALPESGTASEGGASDGGAEGGPGAGCPTGRGPLPVRVETTAGPFCIDSTEVTRAQYEVFLASSPVDTHPRCAWNTSFVPRREWPYIPATKDHPVVGVDWCDAHAFCAWAGKKLCGTITGGRIAEDEMRDATRSAWVHACTRGGTRTFPYGSTFDGAACNGQAFDAGNFIPAGSAPRCQGGYDGIFDLSGNAAEWADACSDVQPPGGSTSGADDSCHAFNSGYTEEEEVDLRCRATRDQPRSYADGIFGIRCCATP